MSIERQQTWGVLYEEMLAASLEERQKLLDAAKTARFLSRPWLWLEWALLIRRWTKHIHSLKQKLGNETRLKG